MYSKMHKKCFNNGHGKVVKKVMENHGKSWNLVLKIVLKIESCYLQLSLDNIP